MLQASFAEIDMICQGGSGVLREGTGTQITLRDKQNPSVGRSKIWYLPTSPVSARFHSSCFPDDSYCFRQVTRQLQIRITSSASNSAGSALTETGSGWFSNQWKSIRTSPAYCWEGQGCAWGSGQPGSIRAVLQCRASVETLMAKSCFQVLLQ